MKKRMNKKRLVEVIWGDLNEDLFGNIAGQIENAISSLEDQLKTDTDEEDSATQDATEETPTTELDDLFNDLKDEEIEPEGATKKTSYF